MRIDIATNLLYCRVPKTGSTALTWWWRENRETVEPDFMDIHMKITKVRERFDVTRYTTFAVIRHPVSWARSCYNHAKNAGNCWTDAIGGIPYDQDQTFLEFCEQLDVFPDAWVKDKDGKIAVDHLFKYEEMDEVFLPWLSEQFQQDISLEHRNGSGTHWPNPVEHTEETIRAVEHNAAPMIAEFYAN